MKSEKMKAILVIIGMLVVNSAAGSFTDSRDGQTYKTVKIGEQTWMAENLNYSVKPGKSSWCYDNDPKNCEKYGRLYTWKAAKNACPDGWHLPSLWEWKALLEYALADAKVMHADKQFKNGTESDVGTAPSEDRLWISWKNGKGRYEAHVEGLLSSGLVYEGVGVDLMSRKGWKTAGRGKPNYGNDAYGFTAFPAGMYYPTKRSYGLIGTQTVFWSSTEIDGKQPVFMWIQNTFPSAALAVESLLSAMAASIRCIAGPSSEDSVPHPIPMDSVQDAAGNSYPTIKIGNQVWMARNMNLETKGSVCYDNKPSNCKKYGRLYSLFAAKKVCPDGWTLPNEDDFEELEAFVGFGGDSYTSKELRAKSWKKGRNTYGFSALPAGWHYRGFSRGIGTSTSFWMDPRGIGEYSYMELNDTCAGVDYNISRIYRSVRCIQGSHSHDEELKDAYASASNESLWGTSDDGYPMVEIGDQVWMAKNMDVETEGSWCYNDNPAYCETFGRLYSWEAAQSVCPAGWHLPSKEDFEKLQARTKKDPIVSPCCSMFVNLHEIEKCTEKDYLNCVRDDSTYALRVRNWVNGSDEYGFSAIPAGARAFLDDDYGYDFLGSDAIFWTSTNEEDAYYSWGMGRITIRVFSQGVAKYSLKEKDDIALSVRCIQNSNGEVDNASSSSSSSEVIASSSSEKQSSSSRYGSLTDFRDWQTYRTVKIGEQIWMAENLNYEVNDGEQSWCYNDNPTYCETFGRLYTWNAAKDACPAGWHLPGDMEWKILLLAVGGENVAGGKLKSTSGWEERSNGTDAFGFSALSAGLRSNGGLFRSAGYYANFWSSSESDGDNAYVMGLYYDDEDARLSNYSKLIAFSVRCVQDN